MTDWVIEESVECQFGVKVASDDCFFDGDFGHRFTNDVQDFVQTFGQFDLFGLVEVQLGCF